MNEGNCKCCGVGLHTKHRVTTHVVLGWNKNGDPIRGLEKDVYVCGDCLTEDVGAKIGVQKPGTPAPAKIGVQQPGTPAPAEV